MNSLNKFIAGGLIVLGAFFFPGRAASVSAQEGDEEEVDENYVPDIKNGEEIFKVGIGCVACHSLNHQGSIVGPDLTQVTVRRSQDWLYEFLLDPPSVVPGTLMPKFKWKSDREIYDVIGFLGSHKKAINSRKILNTHKDPAKAGEKLVEAYDCRACHRIKTGGRSRYPNLSFQGSKTSRNWEWAWLRDPQKIKPGTFMPTFGFNEQELEAISAYIDTLRCEAIDNKKVVDCQF